jgi:hypothetical protein
LPLEFAVGISSISTFMVVYFYNARRCNRKATVFPATARACSNSSCRNVSPPSHRPRRIFFNSPPSACARRHAAALLPRKIAAVTPQEFS